MKFANTVDLKNRTNRILREVVAGTPFVITYRGKPAAAITALSEDDFEDFVLENSPRIRRMVNEAETSRKKGDTVPLESYLRDHEG